MAAPGIGMVTHAGQEAEPLACAICGELGPKPSDDVGGGWEGADPGAG